MSSALQTPVTTARAAGAFLRANLRYRAGIASAVRGHLDVWERRAQAIDEPRARASALGKLHDERLNAEGAAMLASRVPQTHRCNVLEAIVALQVLYDYLDGLSEAATEDPLRDKRQLYGAFLDATPGRSPGPADYYRHHPFEDGGYMEELAQVARAAIGQLPAHAALGDALAQGAARCAEAQVRVHAVQSEGRTQAEDWARRASVDSPLSWREFLAGAAASVIAQHALIATAADDRTTAAHAAELDELYLIICAVTTLLDSVVDHEEDDLLQTGFLTYYDGEDAVAAALTSCAGEVLVRARKVRDGPFHLMVFAGIVAYYATAPGATSEQAWATISPLLQKMRPLISPSLLLWRTWRARNLVRQVERGGRPLARVQA